MNELLVAAAFLALVASPAIFAALPVKNEEDGRKGLADAVRIPIVSAPTHR